MIKVTSVFIHVYPSFVFTVISHFFPNAEERFPAPKELPHLNPLHTLLISGGIYFSWQLLYWKSVLIDRREKIESGQHTTFSSLLNNQRIIGRSLSTIPPQSLIAAFMSGQLVHMVFTELLAVYLLYDSAFWSGVFVRDIWSVSVEWRGYYIEVFGRKFERELEALRKKLVQVTDRGLKNLTRRCRKNRIMSGGEAPYLPLDDLVRLGSTSTRSAMMSLVNHSPALVSNETLPSEGLGVGLEPLSGQAELGIGSELSLDGEQWQEVKKVK
ncbi:hypothetical protein D9758_018187 [Tetrapyrgos nigripes]|uniref:Glycerophosphocholine acyltransferase 1 n=1 Tax=Tetrapyrgos nigripes TaxID=182062 RepID=A0A8H5C5E3_9AGAR|nr:hypothetical protein D9758_018187 [Tetrapyrgos nigripes]